MKKKLIFILSSNYSGSHFLSLLLGSHSRSEHLGELKNIYKSFDAVSCHICEELDNCRLYHDIKKFPKSELYKELFSRVDGKVEFLVDISKKTEWYANFIPNAEYDIRLIHLVRDPRALARRWLIRFGEKQIGPRERIKQIRKNPLKTGKLLFGDLLNVCIYKWISQNREMADFVKSTGLPARMITYKELALKPDETLASICEWVGVSYEPGQKDYWNFEHHGTQKREYEWVKEKGGAQFFDQRWREFLTESQIEEIEKNRDLQSLLEQFSLRFSPEGLEHTI